MAAEQEILADRDRQWLRTVRDMQGDHNDYRRPKRNEFDQWELAELTRRNQGKGGEDIMLRLPDSAYEARRLGCYVD
jgi:hypothetical protein